MSNELIDYKEFFKLIKPLSGEIEIDTNCVSIGWFKEFNEFEINQLEFLEFAKTDLKNNDKKGLINSLSNSKRAIDCQVDKILLFFGINPKKWNLRYFPQKVGLLQEIGIITPRIVQKVIKTRNNLEHEYKCPEIEEVENAIDIATLFIDASNGRLKDLNGLDIGNEHGFIEIMPEGNYLTLSGFSKQSKYIETTITPQNKELYKSLLKLIISNPDEIDIMETLQPMITLINK